ncbi:MAG TPA: hypothetical protein VGP72_33745 [Planctomycetota bacterium]
MPPRSILPWIVLALWLIWLATLICLSRNEWGRPRPVYQRVPPSQVQQEK